MLTGLLPRTLGLSNPPRGDVAACRPVLESNRHRFLPAVLREKGYTTSGVSANPWITAETGFATGFDRFVDVRGRRRAVSGKHVVSVLRWYADALLARVDDGAREAESVVREWVAEGPRQPFFWFVNLMECHSPYLPPRPYSVGSVERLRAARDARRYLTLYGIWRACVGYFDIPDEALERMRSLYRRSIRLMDDWLGRILELLDGRGVLDDTLVIVRRPR
jgi:arylsulfatase A-like enzyme